MEVASGKGKTAVFLAREGYDIISVDTDKEMLKITALNLAYEKLSSKVHLHVMNVYSLEFKKNSFNKNHPVDKQLH